MFTWYSYWWRHSSDGFSTALTNPPAQRVSMGISSKRTAKSGEILERHMSNSGRRQAPSDFWIMHRTTWLPTWRLDENDGQEASLQVDYVRVWAL